MQQKTGYKWKTSEISGISQELERLEKSQVSCKELKGTEIQIELNADIRQHDWSQLEGESRSIALCVNYLSAGDNDHVLLVSKLNAHKLKRKQ